jgi:hypothetical protein
MRSAVLISGLVGALAGIAGDHLLRSHGGEPAPARDAAARDAAADRWEQCSARLNAIDDRLEKIAAAPAAPSRTDAGEAIAAKLEERLAALEAAIGRLAAPPTAAAARLEQPPRHAKEVAAVDRLYEAESAKRQARRDDHLGYSADRLYDRYGAPDSVVQDPGEAGVQRWIYSESNGDRGVIFYLRAGVVVNEDPYQQH